MIYFAVIFKKRECMKLKIEGKFCSLKRVSGLTKFFGLMLSKKRNLLFELDNKKIIVHSFFVFYPIKLYFLDEKFNVKEKTVLKPFWFYIPKIRAKYLIEIPV